MVDSLGMIALTTKDYSDFHKKSSIYEVLANSGELDIMSNVTILLGLQSLEETYTYLNRLEYTHQEVILSTFLNTMNYIRVRPFKVMQPDSLYSYRYQNILELYLSISREKDSLYHSAEMQIDGLMKAIEKELE